MRGSRTRFRASTSVSGTARNAWSPSSELTTPESPKETSVPNEGSSRSPIAHDTPLGAIRCTYTSPLPETSRRSRYPTRTESSEVRSSRTPARSGRSRRLSSNAFSVTG